MIRRLLIVLLLLAVAGQLVAATSPLDCAEENCPEEESETAPCSLSCSLCTHARFIVESRSSIPLVLARGALAPSSEPLFLLQLPAKIFHVPLAG